MDEGYLMAAFNQMRGNSTMYGRRVAPVLTQAGNETYFNIAVKESG
jgi:hypothetical protein